MMTAGVGTGTSISANEQVSSVNGALGKEDFLNLLVTQLRYQNPVNPMSNEDLIAQTAQFSSLEQMQILNENVKSLIGIQESSSKTAALNLIGKQVVVEDTTISLSGVSPVSLSYSLSEDAYVAIDIHGSDGNSIMTIDVGGQLAGQHSLIWDGLDEEGVRLPDGDYTYEVSAVNGDGVEVEASENVSGIVDGIVFGSELYVCIGDLRVPLRAVTEVSPDVGSPTTTEN
jgi:flagellar basal-body rod modification protein FlgD